MNCGLSAIKHNILISYFATFWASGDNGCAVTSSNPHDITWTTTDSASMWAQQRESSNVIIFDREKSVWDAHDGRWMWWSWLCENKHQLLRWIEVEWKARSGTEREKSRMIFFGVEGEKKPRLHLLIWCGVWSLIAFHSNIYSDSGEKNFETTEKINSKEKKRNEDLITANILWFHVGVV